MPLEAEPAYVVFMSWRPRDVDARRDREAVGERSWRDRLSLAKETTSCSFICLRFGAQTKKVGKPARILDDEGERMAPASIGLRPGRKEQGADPDLQAVDDCVVTIVLLGVGAAAPRRRSRRCHCDRGAPPKNPRRQSLQGGLSLFRQLPSRFRAGESRAGFRAHLFTLCPYPEAPLYSADKISRRAHLPDLALTGSWMQRIEKLKT